MLKIKRRTNRTHIKNRWSFGDWYEDVTYIHLTFIGIRVKTLYKYFISYRGELCNL